MTEALRRILWLVPVLVGGAICLFFLFGSTPRFQQRLEQPLFYNPEPLSAQRAARDALADLVAGKPGAEERIQELGGAALPHVLPSLSSLHIETRRRVADALWPIAERMGIAGTTPFRAATVFREQETEISSDDRLVFWQRYYEDHSLDFRPLAVTRLVRRLGARHLSLRQADLRLLDTYSLFALVEQLGRVNTRGDVQRVHELSSMAAHVTGRPLAIDGDASIEEARAAATAIRRLWDDRGPQWTELNRFELLAARFSQTEFAKWVARTARQMSGKDESTLLDRISAHGRKSAPRFLLILFGALVLGPAGAGVIQLLAFRQSAAVVGRWGLRALLALGLCLFVPSLLLKSPSDPIAVGFLCVIAGTLASSHVLQRELSDRIDWRTHFVLTHRSPPSRVAAVARWLAPSIPTYAPLVAAEGALWICCIEVSGGLSGVGSETLRALNEGDLPFLMLVCLGLGVATGALHVVADLTLGTAAWRKGET